MRVPLFWLFPFLLIFFSLSHSRPLSQSFFRYFFFPFYHFRLIRWIHTSKIPLNWGYTMYACKCEFAFVCWWVKNRYPSYWFCFNRWSKTLINSLCVCVRKCICLRGAVWRVKNTWPQWSNYVRVSCVPLTCSRSNAHIPGIELGPTTKNCEIAKPRLWRVWYTLELHKTTAFVAMLKLTLCVPSI